MGMIQCEKHGLCGIVINIENSICEKINKNQEILSPDLVVIKIYLYDNDEYLYNLNYIITNETKERYSIKSVYKIHNEEEEIQLKDLDNLVEIICDKCLNEYKFINNIKSIISEYKNRN